jgi:hypothetical protein
MASQLTRAPKAGDDAPPTRRRLTAEARKSSILEAARRAFTETGDMTGTTIRFIAERAGISEGIIYRLYRQLTGALKEILPLLGLVLFGDPKIARRFYRENLAVAMDRLGTAWQAVETRHGVETSSQDFTARAVMGIALMLALESRNNNRFDRDQAIALASEGTCNGFFPTIGSRG